ncbi:sulfatase-like hydrolase/transferase [Flavivirga rizhaonensis]|uniref:T9SS type A sorting domain-containing protein n=1 Tax=Flavivirga rizhaonensis TaxID=2559571 RepID=A0A4S1DSQ7_9FLAO|nr:sulfatase-like hydrolase/transferase [Flavivirga rizhaonensis]TGV00783.1 T9SS type A sorting domain-containing protein [Flavivirga rizhaonensis]
MKNLTLKTIMLMAVLTACSMYLEAQTAGTKPNVIVILADDLGYGDVGFNRDGSFPADLGVIPTPNIDNLANAGVICKNTHVAHPFCGPSRVAIMTGMMPHRIGAQYNLPNNITTTLGIPTNETYFPKLLQNAGYNTAAIGKWHLGFEEGSYQPLDRGFDYFFGFLGGGKGYFENGYEDNYYNRLGGSNPVTNEYQDPLWRNRGYVAENEFSDAVDEDYLTDVLTDEAISYISANAASSDPFFMYVSYNAPHTPLQAPAAEIAQFKTDNPNFETLVRNSSYMYNANQVSDSKMEQDVRDDIGDAAFDAMTQPEKDAAIAAAREAKIETFTQARITYATMVSNMDTNIGRIVTELKKDINEFNNTVIIFLSDNGGYTYSKGAVNYPLDALKGSVKEGGHKVPMFVHWPAQITSSATYNHQISSLDLYPTLVNLAGGTIPNGKVIDGTDFMDNLIAGNDTRTDEALLIMRPYNGFHNGGLAMGKWKIVKTGSNGSWKLYDILNDPGETTDLRSTEPNAEQIIQDILDQAITHVAEYKDVKPAWYDNDGDGSGHPHSFLWNDGTLPGYNRLFESSLLLLESEISEISIEGVTDAVEGETNGIFTVSLPQGVTASEDINITYTISGEATNTTDYSTLSGTVTIPNGNNSANITIVSVVDGLDEISETITITLQSTSTGTVNSTPASIYLLDAIVPTTLTAGDIAIVGWKAGSGSGALAFMLLKDITATTKISISNRSWKGSQDGWTGDYSIDDVWTWTAGGSFNTGDIFKLDADGLVKQVTGNAEVVVGSTSHDHTGKTTETSDGDFDLATGGDGILIYQVDPFVLPTNPNSSSWITGLNTNGGWGTGGGNTFCALPTALTNGVNANAVGTDQDNGIYNGPLSGTPGQLRASINDSANWTISESTGYNLWAFNKTSVGVSGNIGSLGTLSLDKNKFDKLFTVYPNPAKEYFIVNFNKNINKADIEIVNLTGKVLKKERISKNKSFKVDVSNLPSGLYLLMVKSEDNVTIDKIAKM